MTRASTQATKLSIKIKRRTSKPTFAYGHATKIHGENWLSVGYDFNGDISALKQVKQLKDYSLSTKRSLRIFARVAHLLSSVWWYFCCFLTDLLHRTQHISFAAFPRCSTLRNSLLRN